jgi:hypothetical protein
MNARVTVQHGESGSVFYVVDADAPESEQPAIIVSSRDAQALRPMLLAKLGYVPEPVLEFCNRARQA